MSLSLPLPPYQKWIKPEYFTIIYGTQAFPAPYIDELYKDKRYREIISHKNFNPRLINFITDYTRHEDVAPYYY